MNGIRLQKRQRLKPKTQRNEKRLEQKHSDSGEKPKKHSNAWVGGRVEFLCYDKNGETQN